MHPYNYLPARLLLIFVLFNATYLQTNAQQNFEPQLSVGPFAGVTLSKVSFTPRVKQNYSIAYTVGCKLRFISENHLGFIIEPNYSVYGWNENFQEYESDLNPSYSRKLHYFEFPFLTHIYFGDKQRIFFNAGPFFRYLLGESESMNFSLENEDSVPSTNGEGSYGNSIDKKFDYGIAAGLGFELQTAKGNFLIEGRFYYGLADIFNNHKSDFYPKSSNQNISVTLAYLLPWKW